MKFLENKRNSFIPLYRSEGGMRVDLHTRSPRREQKDSCLESGRVRISLRRLRNVKATTP